MTKQLNRIIKYCDLILSDLNGNIDLLSFYLMQIGENINQIKASLKNSSIPVREIVGLRNVIVHEYYRIEPKIIRQICINDVSVLRTECKNILDKGE